MVSDQLGESGTGMLFRCRDIDPDNEFSCPQRGLGVINTEVFDGFRALALWPRDLQLCIQRQ